MNIDKDIDMVSMLGMGKKFTELGHELGQTVQAVAVRTNADTRVGHSVGQGVQVEPDTIRNEHKRTTGK